MKERPILFSAPMVRALLAGTKTQTRRPLKRLEVRASMPEPEWQSLLKCCPYGQPGDRLWVREAWGYFGGDEYLYQKDIGSVGYRASAVEGLDHVPGGRWRPSIHMPRWASRITLEVTGVRVERLQEISQPDAIAEGAPPSHPTIDTVSRSFGYPDFSRSWYGQLWEQINGPGSWAANPFVWVVSFRRIHAS